MKSKLLFILLVVLAVAACSTPIATANPAPAPEVATGCNAETDNTQTLTDEALGYCVLIPTGFNIEHPVQDEAVIFIGTQMGHGRPQVFINVEEAGGRTPETFAAFLTAGLEQFGVTRTETTLGGEPALVLDKLPGQDVNRQVVAVHGDKLYHLTFVPLNPEDPEMAQEVEELYALVMRSFEFVE